MEEIPFKTELFRIDSTTIILLPENVSVRLPSRGMALIEGTINDLPFLAVLEPDGKGSHWFEVNKTLSKNAGISAGDTVFLSIKPSKNWPEPEVPAELIKALKESPQAYSLWQKITPMARWDWLRWLRSAIKQETRTARIKIACDKLSKGTRRPCCFNRNLCTETSLSHNGVLRTP